MKRIPSVLQGFLIWGAFHLFFEYGIAPLTGALTGTAAPLPSSLVRMYSGMAAVAILLYFSAQEDRWRAFLQPLKAIADDSAGLSPGLRRARQAVLIVIPILAGWWGYSRTAGKPQAPADPPGIHFNLPNQYASVENPLPWTAQNIREGGILYTRNCAMCHGDAQDGNGIFARALQPRPANFRDTGTIAQLDENYLYWRIKEGGPGLPKGSIEYRSAMPRWEGVLNDDEIWKVIMFEYTNAGVQPSKRK